MTPRIRYSFYIDDDQRTALGAIRVRDGIPVSEQIRRAINDWIRTHRVPVRTDRKRSKTKDRP